MEDDDIFRKFVIRKVRKGKGYIQQWQVAYPGPEDKPMQSTRVTNWEEAIFIAAHGVSYIERNGWERFQSKVLHLDQEPDEHGK